MNTVVAEAISADKTERHRIINDGQGMGGFLCPPGHVNLRYWYEVTVRSSGRGRWPDDANEMTTIDAATAGNVPAVVRLQAQSLITSQTLVCSEAWVGEVYGYFKNCYFPSGIVDAGGTIDKTGTPEQHGAYLTVRKYFPDHTPRLDLIESGGSYGTWVCQTCGQRVQYEARIDGFSVYGERTAACVGEEPHRREV